MTGGFEAAKAILAEGKGFIVRMIPLSIEN